MDRQEERDDTAAARRVGKGWYIPQVALAFGLGIYYAAAYHRTGSLLNPILAHNFANGTLYLSSLLLLWLK